MSRRRPDATKPRLALVLRSLSVFALVLAALSLPSALAEDTAPTGEVPDGMVLVAAGKFTKGSTQAQADAAFSVCESERGAGSCLESWFADETPQKEVDVEAFYIDVHEVTVDDYATCVDAGICMAPDETCGAGSFGNWDKSDRGSHPIHCVTWYDAQLYCDWADKRLPSELEWEKAARGTGGSIYPWGDAHPSKTGRMVGNFADATYQKLEPLFGVVADYDDGYTSTSPVGAFPAGASPYGVHDMAGNVWEWTSTETQRANYVIRGGSFHYSAAWVRAAIRYAYPLSYADTVLGFRCARSAP